MPRHEDPSPIYHRDGIERFRVRYSYADVTCATCSDDVRRTVPIAEYKQTVALIVWRMFLTKLRRLDRKKRVLGQCLRWRRYLDSVTKKAKDIAAGPRTDRPTQTFRMQHPPFHSREQRRRARPVSRKPSFDRHRASLGNFLVRGTPGTSVNVALWFNNIPNAECPVEREPLHEPDDPNSILNDGH